MVTYTRAPNVNPRRGTRPRLRLYRITCAECRTEVESWRPRRKTVRDKMSPWRFCCPAHQQRHWRRRRLLERVGILLPYPCAGPGCDKMIKPTDGPGRPRLYHHRSCQRRADRERAEQRGQPRPMPIWPGRAPAVASPIEQVRLEIPPAAPPSTSPAEAPAYTPGRKRGASPGKAEADPEREAWERERGRGR